MNVQKEARRDAHEYARSLMSYGEGAGTRRKLIVNSVASKVERKTGYHEAFEKELARQDMAAHAEAARKERRRKDVTSSVDKNVRGLVSGNYQSVNAGIFIAAGVAYVAHKTGYDKIILAEGKKRYEAGKKKYRNFRNKRNHNITSI